jgi:hypothetical protein
MYYKMIQTMQKEPNLLPNTQGFTPAKTTKYNLDIVYYILNIT